MFSFLTAHQVDPVGGINIKSVFLNMKERPSCCLASQLLPDKHKLQLPNVERVRTPVDL